MSLELASPLKGNLDEACRMVTIVLTTIFADNREGQ